MSQLVSEQRIDPEYFLNKRRQAHQTVSLSDIADITVGATPETKEHGDTPFYRVENIAAYTLSSSARRASYNKALHKKIAGKGDILMTVKGRVGDATMLSHAAFYNQDIVKITVKKINPYLLLALLNSEKVKHQIRSVSTNQMHPYIRLQEVRKLQVPLLKTSVSEIICEKVKKILLIEKSIKKLESDIEGSFDLVESTSPHHVCFQQIKNSSRMDAEFFTSGNLSEKNTLKIGDLQKVDIRIGIYKTVLNKKGAPYIKAKDIKNGSVTSNTYVEFDKKDLTQQKEILLTRVGNVKAICIQSEEIIPSDNFLRIRYQDLEFSPQVLTAYLNSKAGQREIRRHMQGSKQRRLNKKSLYNITVPILLKEQSKQIVQKVEKVKKQKKRKEKLISEVNLLITQSL